MRATIPATRSPFSIARSATIRRWPLSYSEALVRDNLIDDANVEQIRKGINQRLNDIYDASKQESGAVSGSGTERGGSGRDGRAAARTPRWIGRRWSAWCTASPRFPDEFHVHPKLEGFLKKRQEILRGAPIDWATAETLAFGTLVLERTPVRLSGQDSGRGTFSQRHLELYDSETGERYIPLQHLSPNQARFDVFDSSLSEYAVMGFEFGYSVADPLTLVLWEAQFGDFVNGAQILIDQFIASAESKWGQPSGLVLLLPHGYEGQGPEHSSARIERFLTLCAEDNLQVVNASTPAQYFHLLRRQMHGGPDRRGMRKPLIVFTPKRMLRHPKAVSSVNDLMSGSFREVIDDTTGIELSRVSRVLMCSGQVYYDVLAAREERKIQDVAIVRLEQIYPFQAGQVRDILARYPETADVVWVQEEPRNMGAWRFVQEQMQPMLESTRRVLRYAGRAPSASPASGSLKRHQEELAELLEQAFSAEVKLVETKRKGPARAPALIPAGSTRPAVRSSGSSADRSQPPQQEEMMAAKSAAVRPQDPVDCLLHGVANAHASKIDRFAMRTVHGEHRLASFLTVGFRRAAGALDVGAPECRR